MFGSECALYIRGFDQAAVFCFFPASLDRKGVRDRILSFVWAYVVMCALQCRQQRSSSVFLLSHLVVGSVLAYSARYCHQTLLHPHLRHHQLLLLLFRLPAPLPALLLLLQL